eukprot:3762122-Amphidinium_carterae.1
MLRDPEGNVVTGRSTEQEAAQLSVMLESWSQEGPIYGAEVDLSKAFDYVDHAWLREVLRRLGIDEETCTVLSSVALRKKTQTVEGLVVKSYADDLLICAKSPEVVQAGLDIIGRFCEDAGFKVNADKSSCWAMGNSDGLDLRLQRTRLSRVRAFNYLGCFLLWGWGSIPVRSDARLQARHAEYERRLDKLRYLPLGRQMKMRLITTAITPVLMYGAWSYRFPQRLVMRWRTKITNALFDGSLNGPRCQEIVHTLFCPVHLVDPLSAMFWYTLRIFTKHVASDGRAWHLLRNVEKSAGLCATMRDLVRTYGLLVDLVGCAVRGQGFEFAFPPASLDVAAVAADAAGSSGASMVGAEEMWCHNWREVMRRHLHVQAAARRSDMHGIAHGINREWLRQQYVGRSDVEGALLRAIHTGSVIVPERALRHRHGVHLAGDEDLVRRRLQYKQVPPLSYVVADAACWFCGKCCLLPLHGMELTLGNLLRITDALLASFAHWQQRYRAMSWEHASTEAAASKHVSTGISHAHGVNVRLDSERVLSENWSGGGNSEESLIDLDVCADFWSSEVPNEERKSVTDDVRRTRQTRVQSIAPHFEVTSEGKILCSLCEATGSWQQVSRFMIRHQKCVRPKFRDAKGRPSIALPTGFEYCVR